MSTYHYLILGGGVAAGYAAQAFVEAGGKAGELCIISADSQPPYERPPLSKGFLTSEDSAQEILINTPQFYQEHGIDLRLNTRVDKVDFDHCMLHMGKQQIGFDQLLITTGSHVEKLDVPGAQLGNIFYLRSIMDAQQIRTAAQSCTRAVIIGGGFIGMEVASSLQQEGISTTLVFPNERVWESFFTPEMSTFFEDYYRRQGVQIISGRTIVGFTGQPRVASVWLDNHHELPTELVVVGIGVAPNVALFQGTGLQITDGILVNRYLETNIPNVFAAGDVAQYHDPYFNKRRRVEHWDSAFAQGQHAMRAMMGQRENYAHLPYFFSDVFDLSYEFWGDTSDFDQVIYRGEVAQASFSVWWLRGEQLVAAFVLDRPKQEGKVAQAFIKSGEPLPLEQLRDPQQDLAQLAEQV